MAPLPTKAPTHRQKAEVLHLIACAACVAQIGGNTKHFEAVVDALSGWSRAHRIGNGELTDRELNERISRAYWNLDRLVRRVVPYA